MRWWVFVVVCCGGCGSLKYEGWSPSFRYMRDDPGLRDVYFGADATFAVEEPASQGLSTAALVARNQPPVDAWNTPVAWQPLSMPAEARPVAEAGVSPADALNK